MKRWNYLLVIISALTLSFAAYSNGRGDNVNVYIDLESSEVRFTRQSFTNPNRVEYMMSISNSEGLNISYNLGQDDYGATKSRRIQEIIYNHRVLGTELINLQAWNFDPPEVFADRVSRNQEADQSAVIQELREELSYQRSIVQAFVAGNHCALENNRVSRYGESNSIFDPDVFPTRAPTASDR